MVNIEDLKNSYNRIQEHLVKTPILTSTNLNQKLNANIYLKNEVEVVQCKLFSSHYAILLILFRTCQVDEKHSSKRPMIVLYDLVLNIIQY